MADTKISAFTDGVTAIGTDDIAAARAGANVRITPAYIRTYLLALANTWTGEQTFDLPANTSAIVVTGYSLTGSNAQSAVDLSGTWNTSGAPTAVKLNLTDTTSDAASLFWDLQISGVSQWKVRKDGRTTQTGASVASAFFTANAAINFDNAEQFKVIGTGGSFGFAPSTILSATADTGIMRSAAAVIKATAGSSGEGYFKPGSFIVSGLLAASTAGAGTLAYVTDATATTRGSTVAGGGSNKVLVCSDGTNWSIV